MVDPNFRPIEWLQAWYRSHCDGDWEHDRRIRIGTLDNPGWSLYVNLEGTSKAESVVPRRLIERSENDWVSVVVKDGHFEAHGGPENLSEMIRLFAELVEDE
ncbi:MAG: hypothetical protein JWO86_1918 [Myxococcaceae bacterium]|nr:hypothetical protein [Myxococcaceae bacterium]